MTLAGIARGTAAETLKIGVLPGVYADSVNAAVADAAAQSIDLKVIEFSDWTTPNIALQAGDIDVNYFQHRPFLDNAIKAGGFDLTDAGIGVLANIGLYSLKHKSFAAIPENGSVAIASDPVNQGRCLVLMQTAGLIKLKDGVGIGGTIDDIVANPKHLRFSEVDGPQLARVATDVDLAFGYPHYIVAAHAFDPSSGLLYSGVSDKQFAILFAVRKNRVHDPLIAKFVAIYQASPAVKASIAKAFANDPKLYALPWEHSGQP
ncbi:MetQ/NlpA family ABC transporter substrate-binding protein [Lichenihabitans sp. Uapishka_5]|uniref:MetQ/NlpA family ABC transporter substrate-binding protein n=1 Tax=Lichenihabitans sp. Uapishka_5 TaxID=3037302 RepID=UPI0029E8056E|nr:MetQ/NlpA family ABC transporter substrate-binding protein [Lichenihabitans sp. Uapishka_5]MDX7952613.1 MetQ/NlpA family ABC transporter substrate-binding protein [Lichenihabitans sp. Uapishka_5]